MARMVGIQFCLKSGQTLCFWMPEIEGNRLVQEWASEALTLKGKKKLTGVCAISTAHWAVDMESLTAVHTVYPREDTTPQGGGWGNHFLGKSGLN